VSLNHSTLAVRGFYRLSLAGSRLFSLYSYNRYTSSSLFGDDPFLYFIKSIRFFEFLFFCLWIAVGPRPSLRHRHSTLRAPRGFVQGERRPRYLRPRRRLMISSRKSGIRWGDRAQGPVVLISKHDRQKGVEMSAKVASASQVPERNVHTPHCQH
jgi:hypothetical protein